MTPPTHILTAQVQTEGDDQVVLLPEGVWFTGSSVNIRREGDEVVLSEQLNTHREPERPVIHRFGSTEA